MNPAVGFVVPFREETTVPKNRYGLFAIAAAFVAVLSLNVQPAFSQASRSDKFLTPAQLKQKSKLLAQQHRSRSVVNFWRHRGRWILAVRHEHCWQLPAKRWRRSCKKARRSLAHHSRRLERLRLRLESFAPWVNDVARTYAYRQCLIGHESATSGLYTAENGGTRYVEGGGHSNASGAYQFLDSTWQSQFKAAKANYGPGLSGTWTHAADAPPQVQDAVAAYAITTGGSDWTYSDCKAISF